MFNRQKAVADAVTVRSIAETTAAVLGPDHPDTEEAQYRAEVWTDTVTAAGVTAKELAEEARRRGLGR